MMRGACALALVAVVATGCRPDQPSHQARDRGGLPESGREEEPASASAQPVRYRIFNRDDLADPPRATIHLLVDSGANRDELRVTLAKALEEEAARDSAVVALRAVGYVGMPSKESPRQADLVPVAWAEWLPPDGWYEAHPEDRVALHRVYFYHGNPPEWY